MKGDTVSIYGKLLRRMVRCWLFFLILPVVLALWLMPQSVRADDGEVINRFDSVVRVQPDGTLLVQETITATALGEDIKRGLYRDFPLRYAGPGGYGGDVPFKVLSVTLDGKPLSSDDVETVNGDLRIFMRDAEPLPHGAHTFVLNYATSLHVRQFAGADELNWNVTGAGWAFPIEQVSCQISLPEGAVIGKKAGWLGEAGSKVSPLTIEQLAPGEMRFVGNQPVQPGEQFTVAVSFPKGVITEKTPEPRLLDKLFALNNELWFKALLIALSVSYYVLTWFVWGRDPKAGPIVPLFHAPLVKGNIPLSSVATPYILECKQLTNEGFASLFLSLALRGLCAITKTAEGFSLQLHVQDPPQAEKQLAEEERTAYYTLLNHVDRNGKIELNADPSPAMQEVHTAVLDRLEEQYGALWQPNTWIMYTGLLVLLPFCFTLGLGTAHDILESAVLGVMSGIALLYVTSSARRLFRMFMQRKRNVIGALAVVGLILWMSFDSVDEITALFSDLVSISFTPDDALLLALFVPPVIFQTLMKAPSPACRALMDRIEGFQMYINTAEKNRIAALNGPDETPEVFQEVLPYAVALGLTATWCSRFADQLASGLIVNENIRLDDWNDRSLNKFVHSFSRSAASVSQSSGSSESAFSSGGGGAGSGSGGGGGGGC